MNPRTGPGATLRSLLWLLFLLLPLSSWLRDGDADVQFGVTAVYAALFGSWLVTKIVAKERIDLPDYFLVLLAFYGLLLARIPGSPIRSHALETVVDLGLLLVVLLILLNELGKRIQPRPMLNAIALLALILSLGNLILVSRWLVQWVGIALETGIYPPFGYRLPGAFLGHPNVEAGMIGLTIPIAVMRAWDANRRNSRILWGMAVLVFLIVLFFTSSRAGWIGTGVGVAAATLFRALPSMSLTSLSELGPRLRSFLGDHLLYVIVIAVGLAGLVALLWIQVANTPHAPLSRARFPVWGAGLAIFGRSPLIGNGPGSVHVLVAVFDRFITEAYFIHPHNVPLLLLGEAGALGLGLVLLSMIAFVRAASLTWMGSPVPWRIGAAGAIGAVVTAAVHNQADVLFEAPVYSISVIMIALSLLKADGSPPSAATLLAGPVPVGISMVALLLGQLLLLRGIGPMEGGMDLVRRGESKAGSAEICRAAEAYPAYALSQIQCGLALTGDPSRPDGLPEIEAAKERVERGLDLDPYWPWHWANLGALQWATAERTQAQASLEQARLRAPQDPRILATYGWMAEAAGEEALAEDLYRSLLQHNPGWSGSVFFSATPLRRQILRSQPSYDYGVEIEELTVAGWHNLATGRPGAARTAFASALALQPRARGARVGLASALQASGAETEAWREARISLLGGSGDARVLLNAGKIAYDQGREPEASSILSEGWRLLSTRNDSDRYYSIVYRRAFLPYDTVPQVIDPRLTTDMAVALELLASILVSEDQSQEAEIIRDYIQAARGPLP